MYAGLKRFFLAYKLPLVWVLNLYHAELRLFLRLALPY
jgi:hypothetical protein